MPAVSVIMPCFNAAAHVVTSMRSALDQTYSDLELIVVDDDSTDNTISLVEGVSDERVRLLRQPHAGVSAARNRGVAEARGQFIAFLDADDTWTLDCIEKLHRKLADRPDAVLAYCGWQNLGLPGTRGAPFVPPEYEGADKVATMLPACPWPIHAALTRTASIRAAGAFDRKLSNAEDFKLWLEVAASGRIVRVPEVLAFYHHHGGEQASRNAARAAHQIHAVQREFVARHPAARSIGQASLRRCIEGGMLYRGYERYWAGDLENARAIFRRVIRTGYGRPRDWMHMLPALLPLGWHRALLKIVARRPTDAKGGQPHA